MNFTTTMIQFTSQGHPQVYFGQHLENSIQQQKSNSLELLFRLFRAQVGAEIEPEINDIGSQLLATYRKFT